MTNLAHHNPWEPLKVSANSNIAVKLEEAEKLIEEAQRLLVHCGSALDEEGVREEALALERWIESYRRGMSAAKKLSQTGPELLDDMSKRLHQALEELHRYEAEGGNPATKAQQAQIEELTNAMKRVNQLKEAIQNSSFITPTEKTDE